MRVIDEDYELPFQMELLVGTRGKEERIPLHSVCMSGSFLHQCLYTIQELKPIKLKFVSKDEGDIRFVWNKTYRVYSKEEEERHFNLKGKETMVTIYEHGKTDFSYPWRFGVYHFEITHGHKRYYGGIQIEPKNVDWNQFQWMLQFMNQYVEGIFLDPKFRKNTPNVAKHFQNKNVLHMIDQYVKHASSLLSCLRYVKQERTWTIEREYLVEKVPKKRDGRSIREEGRKGKGYYNRHNKRKKGIPFLKQLRQIQHDLYIFQEEVKKANQKVEAHIEDIQGRIKKINAYHHSVKNNIAITDRDKTKYRQLIQVYTIDVDRLTVEKKQLQEMNQVVGEFLSNLTALVKYEEHVEEGFLSKQEKKLKSIIHEILYPRKKKLEVELKPTYLLYEYFVYFASINSLMELGFQVESSSIATQLEETILNEDLLDGSLVVLKRGHQRVHVVFNELIDSNYDKNQWKTGKLFSGEESRKPDVRIDYFEEVEGKNTFLWSILIEVKYSPLYNIYQQLGNTKAMEQMYRYWSIKYVYEEEGRKRFHRTPIKEVICIYPGGHPYRVIEDGSGVFLQLYPSKENDELMGQQELMKIIQRCMGETEKP